MPEKKINLNEIWKRKFPHGKLPDYAREIAMEFAKELLELAAENALVVSVPVFMQQILDENGNITGQFPQYGYSVDKQSILNTLDQVG